MAAVASVWDAHMVPGDKLHQHVRLALEHNMMMDDILDRFPDENKLPPRRADDLVMASHVFLTQYQEAAREVTARVAAGTMSGAITFFDITVKAHVLLHIAVQSRWMNPRKTSCWAGEDYMMHCKRLLGVCTRSVKAQNVCNKFLAKYVMALDLRFDKSP